MNSLIDLKSAPPPCLAATPASSPPGAFGPVNALQFLRDAAMCDRRKVTIIEKDLHSTNVQIADVFLEGRPEKNHVWVRLRSRPNDDPISVPRCGWALLAAFAGHICDAIKSSQQCQQQKQKELSQQQQQQQQQQHQQQQQC